MEEEKKITKIVINKEDEITDIVSAILESQNERIVLTFAEETDLLISPINLKVLLETSDEAEKMIVGQIIKNPTGLRNANLAGIATIDTPSFPTEDIWEKEEINRAKRLNPPKKELPKKESVEEKVENEPSDFQKRIDNAIEKSREKKEISDSKRPDSDSILISLDEDLPSSKNEDIPIVIDPDLSKVDFSKKTKDLKDITPEKRVRERKNIKPQFNKILASVGAFFAKIPIPTKFRKLAPLIGGSIVLLFLLVGFIYLNTALLVRVKIYVEAREVSIEREFQGDENIKEIDFEALKIPVKSESVEKSRSTDIKATGNAFKGEKAKGSVNITYIKDPCDENVDPVSLAGGSSLSTGGKTYTLDSTLTIKCNTPTEASITAIEVGEEYNISQGQLFVFQGYSTNEILVLNNNSAITGGSKEEYTVLSKADVDAGVEELKKIAVEEGENELREKTDKWVIIEDSIKSEVVDDSIKTGVAIGAEANQTTLSIKTESTASYYLKDGFDDGVAEMLTEEAKEKNLFETDKDWELELDTEIEKEITVVENNSAGIKIKLVATSSVKPKVDKEEIASKLRGMKWEEGQEYAKDLIFSEKETRVEFSPENFPEFLRRFPKRQGGVLVEVADIE
jgi:hypothetical protein